MTTSSGALSQIIQDRIIETLEQSSGVRLDKKFIMARALCNYAMDVGLEKDLVVMEFDDLLISRYAKKKELKKKRETEK